MSTNSIANIAGSVLTVNGLVDPDDVGIALMHEHVLVDISVDKAPRFSAPVTDLDLWQQKLTLENLHYVIEGKHIKDNYILADESLAAKELQHFKDYGGMTVVEVSSIGLARDPLGLRRVAKAVSLNIVMGSGWYQTAYHPPNMDQRTVEDLTEEIVRDITLGVDDTGIRSGIIGEVGINGNPLKPNEIKSIKASARASRATGAAISFHKGGTGREKLEVASILGEEGADLSRVVYGHSDWHAGEIPLLLEVLELGAYIQFDILGRVSAPVARYPNNYDQVLNAAYPAAKDVLVAEAIPQLLEAGYEDKILLSQDVCWKSQLKAYGGTGYSFIQEKFLPYLRTKGVSDPQIDKMMVANPTKVLTFAEAA